MKRSEAYRRFERIRDELASARFALAVVARDWHLHVHSAPVSPGRMLNLGDFNRCRTNLELTYIVRLFAAFEGILRDYWLTGMRRRTEPGMKLLMESIASRRRMDQATLAAAHEIRNFRNRIVHEDVKALRLDFTKCGQALGAYVSWLPIAW